MKDSFIMSFVLICAFCIALVLSMLIRIEALERNYDTLARQYCEVKAEVIEARAENKRYLDSALDMIEVIENGKGL